ncbi:4-hydroxy-tetrahydrodipicolinate synthase [Povalibacter uvarum]|uniref:4-hydroxy-tetrahydrodipicolinate synthase n=1 Tax=Povalibacter uvarum TaxID=732238 RepID=A0A841HEM0_9GAMM|nr:dihydrodipicolinate synthase family protein [Povalibacter uvarum]MBB6091307.1 4-hydroxy-tetrahydrodipicolinate synthase [Povalibacter uvarum]
MATLSGVLPILPTIFTTSGAIDEAGTRRVVDYIIGAGARGIVFPGLASEYDTLTRDERLHLTQLLGGWIGGRVPFVVGASAASTDDAIAYAAAGAKAGAAASMILTPKTFADDPAGMRDFYRAVHDGSGIDIMLQNAPAPMGIGLSLEKVAELAKAVDGIRYVKEEAPPSGQRITRLSELAGDSLRAVFGGAGARYVIDELLRGAKGTMPACEITELHVAMFDRFERGDEAGARDLFERTLPLLNMQAIFRWRLTKAVLQRRGLIESTFVRAPGPEFDRYDWMEFNALVARLDDLMPLEAAA